MMYCDRRLFGYEFWHAQEPRDAHLLISDYMLESVCFIGFQDRHGEFQARGTAFFVRYEPISKHGPSWTYLVTAKHVVKKAHDEALGQGSDALFARMNTKDGSELIGLQAEWKEQRDNPAVDVAVLRMDLDRARFRQGCIGLHSVATPETMYGTVFGIGSEVLSIGLFKKHTGSLRNLPIVRQGILSSMPREPLEDEFERKYTAYLIELQSIGGLSGSPVFVWANPRHLGTGDYEDPDFFTASDRENGYLYLLGVILGHFDEKNELESAKDKSATPAIDKINTGIAVAAPILEVLKVIEVDPDLKRDREETLAAIAAKKRKSTSVTLDAVEPGAGKPFPKEDFVNALKKASKKLPE